MQTDQRDAGPTLDSPNLPEVIEMPAGEAAGADLAALLIKHSNGQVVECPTRPPMCPEGRLAVTRERRLVLIVAANSTLSELRIISEAYRWVTENRSLLSMAMPQFALDAHQLPQLWLLIDQAAMGGQVLRALLPAETVTIHTFQRVKWGPRMGVLLDAA